MREIKFRGRDEDGRWVSGDLLQRLGYWPSIFESYRTPEGKIGYRELAVDERTVGQYTGLKDKNGREIYEGDILRLQTFRNRAFEESFEEQGEISRIFAIEDLKGEMEAESVTPVRFCEGIFSVGIDWEDDTYFSCLFGNQKCSQPIFEFEVIGNIHDNPEIEMRYSDRFKKEKEG